MDRPATNNRARAGTGWRRLIVTGFGIAALTLAGAVYLSLGVAPISGTVTAVETAPRSVGPGGIDVTVDHSRPILIVDPSQIYPPPSDARLPEVRLGDHVEIWVKDTGERELWGLAVRSQRGTWLDSAWSDNVPFFTPDTWSLHETIRWSGFVLTAALASLGLVGTARGYKRQATSEAPMTTEEAMDGGSPRADRLPMIVVGVVALVLLLATLALALSFLNQLH